MDSNIYEMFIIVLPDLLFNHFCYNGHLEELRRLILGMKNLLGQTGKAKRGQNVLEEIGSGYKRWPQR